MSESQELLAKYIIVADDDMDDVHLFREVLADITQEVEVEVAENGKMLIDMLIRSTRLPDLIFLDLNMHLKNGLQCLKEIKENEGWRSIKVVILSTSSHPYLVEQAYTLGADLYLPKAIHYSEFKESIVRCLQFNLEKVIDYEK